MAKQDSRDTSDLQISGLGRSVPLLSVRHCKSSQPSRGSLRCAGPGSNSCEEVTRSPTPYDMELGMTASDVFLIDSTVFVEPPQGGFHSSSTQRPPNWQVAIGPEQNTCTESPHSGSDTDPFGILTFFRPAQERHVVAKDGGIDAYPDLSSVAAVFGESTSSPVTYTQINSEDWM